MGHVRGASAPRGRTQRALAAPLTALSIALSIALLAALSATAYALPAQFIQEGLVVDDDERPLDGEHQVRIRLYTAAQGGAPIFDERHPAVPFFEGYYAVAVGSEEALTASVFTAEALYLTVAIDGGAELAPRTPLARVPAAFVAQIADNATGDITPRTVTVGGRAVIDQNGRWVGDPTGLRGPAGPAGAQGPAGPQGERGPAGQAGQAGGDGSPDTPAQVLAKLVQVDGAGSGVDADRLDGLHANQFVRTAAEVKALLVTVDGAGSGVDADRLDGRDSTEFVTTAEQVRDLLRTVDGNGSGVDADRLDGRDSTEFVSTAAQVRDLLRTVDGSGSGVDADRLDGLDSSQFLRADGNVTIAGNLRVTGTISSDQPAQNLRVYTGNAPPAACNAAARGMIYFDTTDSQFHGCNGTAWVPFGAADDGIGRSNVEVSGHFGDRRDGDGNWRDLPERTVSIAKSDPTTIARITYQDVLGYHMVAHNDACIWRLVIDGQVTDRLFRTHTSGARGWRIQPMQLEWFVDGLGAGNHTYQIQVYRSGAASECLAGWAGGDTHNFIAVEEVPRAEIAIARHFGDTRHTPNDWDDLPGRALVADKTSDDTTWQISYQDTLGYRMTGGHSWGCRWRLTMNGAPVDRPFSSHTSTTSGWRIDPRNLTWILDGIPRGRYTFRIQVARPNNGSTSECLAGWGNGSTANSFTARELDRDSIAIRRHMSDTRHTPAGWSDLPEREIVHRKGGGTKVRVTYMDDIGYHMVGHGWGCRWRLTVDGNAFGRAINTHTSTARGWRIDPKRMEWIVPNLPAGNHTYRVQLYRPDANTTSECLAGWPNADAGNFLMVQEVD